MKVDRLGVGRIPVNLISVAQLQNQLSAAAQATSFAIEVGGVSYRGWAMLRREHYGGLTLILPPVPAAETAKYADTYDWENQPASVAPPPLAGSLGSTDPPPALEGGEAA